MLQNPRNSKISNFDLATLCHEDILSLQISVEDLPIVDVLDSQGHLDKPVQDLILSVTHFAYFLLIGDPCIQIVAVCIVHNDAQTPLIHETFFVGDDVRMSHCFEHMHFIDGILSLLAVHLRYINNFHDISLSVSD